MFVSRSIFIKILGANIAGLNSLLISLIGFLNVAELGVSVAVGYSLYKPLNDRNYNKISEIMILFKYYYNNIAKIVLIIGIIICLFLPFLIKGQINLGSAYIYYYIYLVNCVLSYMFTYKQTLIISDQKQYKIAFTINLTKILKVCIQCFQLIIIPSFFIWLIIEVIFNVLSMILVNKKIDKEYSEKVNYNLNKDLLKIKKENKSIKKNIRNIFFHKIGGFVVFQTDSILISMFSSLKEIAVYSNYMMIINSLIGLLNSVVGSIMPTIGNLIAEDNDNKSYKIFRLLYMLDHLIAIFVTFITFKVINQFIIFWVGKEYLFAKSIVLVLLINLYIRISRGTIDRFKNGFGIYWDIYSPVIESVVNLILSLILTYKFGIIGIFIGTIISNILIIEIWQPYVVFKYGFKKSIKNYIFQTSNILFRNLLVIIITNFILNKISINITNYFISLIFNILFISIIFCVVYFFIFITDKDFKNLLKEGINFLKIKKQKNIKI